MKNTIYFIYLFIFIFFYLSAPLYVNAQETSEYKVGNHIDARHRLSLARSFVAKLKSGFKSADKYLYPSVNVVAKNILPDGETLLLQPVLAKKLKVEGIIWGFVKGNKILLSLRDVANVLQLPISLDIDNKTAKGWYVREEKEFFLDLNNKIAQTDIGEFNISDDVIIKDNDLWIPSEELGRWIDFEFNPVISEQELRITSSELLPIQSRNDRRKADYISGGAVSKPVLPIGNDEYKAFGLPSIDVATNSTYRKSGPDSVGVAKHNVDIRSAGDLAYGTLTTRSRLNNDDRLTNFRVNYKQESTEADLLGPLNARRFDVGDIITTRVPFGGQISQELGVRVTNTDPLRTFNNPTTGISGTAFPGWDVELYRNNQIIGFREVGDDGFYSFDDVDLYLTNNNFKLIFYGPQGEVREENVFVPVNQSVTRGGNAGVYDVSLSLKGKSTYDNKVGFGDDEDQGSLNLSAFYERPIIDGVAVSAGLWSAENKGKRDSVVSAGASANIKQALINVGLAVDDEGDVFSEISVRKDIRKHEIRERLRWTGEGFDTQFGSGKSSNSLLSNNLSISGPLPLKFGKHTNYLFGTNYSLNGDGRYAFNSNIGFNTSVKYLYFNQQLQNIINSGGVGDSLLSITNVTGTIGRNRLRFGSSYEIKPDNELRSMLASYRRDFTNKIKAEVGVVKRYQNPVTEYSAKLDWQTGFMRISPSIRYNSEQAFFAGLNTRFGVLRDPARDRVKLLDRSVTNVGAVSVFVFLDKDGNGEFDGDDEPLEDVVVKAPQNGGRVKTDSNGVAFFKNMVRLRLTDITLDKDTLQDPVWVSGFEGVSVLPREGYVAEVNFPVHMSGEVDGVVYVRAVSKYDEESGLLVKARPVALRNIKLKLYNDEGQLENSVRTDSGGFYYFPQVPPGRYLLIIDENSAERGKFIRPEPQQLEINYDGNVIYGNDIFVDTGEGDIPSEFLPDLETYKKRHPHVDFSQQDSDLVLNLGEFNSRLLMSVVWYKLRSRYSYIFAGGKLFVPPTKSFASVKTGKHTLRVGLNDVTLDKAYAKCRSLMARDQYCKVEIYPSYMKHANAGVIKRGRSAME